MERASGTTYQGELTFPGGAVETSDLDLKATCLRETLEEIPGLKTFDIDILDYQYPFTSEEYFKYEIRGYLGEVQQPVDIHKLNFNKSEVNSLQFLSFEELLKTENSKTYIYYGQKGIAGKKMNGTRVPIYDLQNTSSTSKLPVSELIGWPS